MPPKEHEMEVIITPLRYIIYAILLVILVNITLAPISASASTIGMPATIFTLLIAYIARRRHGFIPSLKASTSIGLLFALIDIISNMDSPPSMLIMLTVKDFIVYPLFCFILGLEVNLLVTAYEKRYEIIERINNTIGRILGIPTVTTRSPPPPPSPPKLPEIMKAEIEYFNIIDKKIKPGAIAQAIMRIKNTGTTPLNLKMEFWLINEGFNRLLDVIRFKPIHPNEVYERETYIKIPSDLGEGVYSLKVILKYSDGSRERILDSRTFRIQIVTPISSILKDIIGKPVTSITPTAPTVKSIQRETIIEGYRIIGLLGYGSFSYTFLAKDEKGRRYVLKVPVDYGVNILLGRESLETVEVTKEFLREAEILGKLRKLNHPHIIRFYGTLKSIPALVFEYCSCGSLAMILKEGKIPLKQAVVITLQIADALIDAYERAELIAHRDLKPSNILFTGNRVLRVTDFNVSKIMSTVSRTQSIVGTYGYSAPEQFDPYLGEVSEKSDVFALAIILYEMITGNNPLLKLVNEYNISYENAVKEVKWSINSLSYSDYIVNALKELISESTRLAPEDRLSMREFRDKLIDIFYLL